MTTKLHKPPVLVVIQLSGGLDFMNTLIPFESGVIRDARPTVSVPVEDMLPLNDELAWHPAAKALKELYDAGNVAAVQGIGYENSSRAHFRAMGIWRTGEPNRTAARGRRPTGPPRVAPLLTWLWLRPPCAQFSDFAFQRPANFHQLQQRNVRPPYKHAKRIDDRSRLRR